MPRVTKKKLVRANLNESTTVKTKQPAIEADLLEGLNDVQRAVAEHDCGNALMSAVPGSGKTHTVVRRIANMVRKGHDPERILATTFTKKAAGEMNERLAKLGVTIRKRKGDGGARVGTFHSVCWEIVCDGSPWQTYQLDDKNVMRFKLKDILGWKGMKWKGVDITEVETFISRCKNDLITPDDADQILRERQRNFRAGQPNKDKMDWFNGADLHYVEAYHQYEDQRHRNGLITFDDMLKSAVEWLRQDRDTLLRWQDRYDHVVIDEFQDSNKAQYELMRLLSENAKSLLVVGDCDQCQPPDTDIAMENGTFKHIEDIGPGDRVRVFQKKNGRVVGARKVNKVASRYFEGDIYTVEAGGVRTRATPNHRFFVRWGDKSTKKWAVYLMRKEWRFRIGVCQIFNSEGTFHLGMRARLEGADAVWILDVYNDQTEAHTNEVVKSLRYQIPTCCFNPDDRTVLDTEAIFREVRNDNLGMESTIIECLEDHGRNIEHPIWPVAPSTKGAKRGKFARGGSRTMKIHVCNIQSNLMDVCVAEQGWVAVERVYRKYYSGDVYSLDVAEHHSYVADGIASCNCIYQFRGSKPEYTMTFEQVFGADGYRAEANYRSRSEVLDVANEVIKNNNPDRVDVASKPQRQPGGNGTVTWQPCEDMDAEAETVVQRMKELRQQIGIDEIKWGDMFVLYRCNAQSRAFEEVLLREKIPHVVVNGTDFYSRKEIADVLAYLRVAVNNKDDKACERAINRPFRYIGRATIDKLKGIAKRNRISLLDAVCDHAHNFGLQQRQVRSLQDFVGIVEWVRGEVEEMDKERAEGPLFNDPDADLVDQLGGKLSGVPHLLSQIIQRTGYEQWLLSDEGSDTAENSRVSNLRELVRTSHRFQMPTELLDHVEHVREQRRKAKKGKADAVLLMTAHSSKGLEAPAVFVVGASEEIFPHARAEDVNAERNLFYVAITRAKERLMVTSPLAAIVGGQLRHMDVSRFVREGGLLGGQADA